MKECKWLPEMLQPPNWNNYTDYENNLYKYFLDNIYNKLYFNSNKISMRKHKIINGKYESFYHITCKDYNKINERQPDQDRMVRINWIEKILKNTPCLDNCCNSKPLYWKKEYKNKRMRHKFYFQKYIVILEERPNFFLFITAYYVQEEYVHIGFLKEYKEYKDNN